MELLAIFLIVCLAALALRLAYRFGLIPGHRPKVLIGFKRRASGVIFGKKGPGTVAYSPASAEGAIAVFGGSGLGKTAGIVVPALRCWPGSAFVIDIAGDISKNAAMPGKLEYCPEDAKSLPYNLFGPIDEIKGQAERLEALERLAFLIMPDKQQGRNDSGAAEFFNSEGRRMLVAALICWHAAGLDIIPICERIIQSDWKTLLNGIASQKDAKANQYIRSFSGASEQNTAGCKQALDAAIKLFATNEIVKKTIRRPYTGEACFTPAVLENNSVFVRVSDARLALYAPLLQIITAQVLDYFADRPEQNTKTILLCLDEFASLGKLDILHALRKLRKRHVRIMMCTQSLADLDLIYGEPYRRAMLDNFDFKVILGANDVDTREYFSRLIGEEPEKKQGGLISKIAKLSIFYTSRNEHTYMVRKMPPEKLGQLGNNLVLLSPDGYALLRKNFYFRR